MKPCQQQVRLFAEVLPQLTQEIGADPAIEIAEKYNWQLVGCEAHKVTEEFPDGVVPCGNKAERGVPMGASCLECPFASTIDTLRR